jgi:CheY-like chemotaxis protein
MARKRALVVDDSRSARIILSRMLEKYDIEVDMAESAEQAIDYLNHHRPDAIFMDHLMPGMDGLQALKVIKENAQTATIPIMMYTSQEGELYVGQARALGAMGVLPKQVRPVDVSKVLYELHLLHDRRDREEPLLTPAELDASLSAQVPTGAPAPVRASTPVGAAPELIARSGGAEPGSRFEALVKDQSADLRRFIVASMDSFAGRIVSDLRTALPSSGKSSGEAMPQLIAPPPPGRIPWPAITVVACCCAIGFAILSMLARGELARARTDAAALSAANAELTRSRQELADTVKDLSNALAAGPLPAGPQPANPATSSPSLSPIRVESVPYGEMPLDRGRLDALRELLSRLEAQGAHGAVRITSYAGLFCLSGNAADGYLPAAASLPLGKCDLIGNPSEDSSFAQQRQSLAFANLIAGIRQRTSGAITVAIETSSGSKPASLYPPRSDALTAGDWNKVAAANNRVEFSFEPSAP